jgi:LPXTG-motif cell wall-anchored protein
VAGSTLSYIQVNFFDKSGSLDKDPGFTNTCNRKPTPAKTTTATAKGGSAVVKTGDTTQPLWVGLGIAGAVAVAAGVWMHGRKSNGQEF